MSFREKHASLQGCALYLQRVEWELAYAFCHFFPGSNRHLLQSFQFSHLGLAIMFRNPSPEL